MGVVTESADRGVVTLPERRALYYGGAWHAPSAGRMFAAEDPATRASLGVIAEAGPEDVDLAVRAARHQHRDVHHSECLVGVRASKLTPQRQHQRHPLEEGDFLLPSKRVEIALGGHAHDVVDLGRRVAREHVPDVVLGHLDQLGPVRRGLARGQRSSDRPRRRCGRRPRLGAHADTVIDRTIYSR